MLNVVEHHLIKEGFRCCTIQGNVPVKQRSQIVDAFNSDPSGPTVSTATHWPLTGGFYRFDVLMLPKFFLVCRCL
jgi:hypothetical protein